LGELEGRCIKTVAVIAIVGGAGFLGLRLARVLDAKGHVVRIVDVTSPANGLFTHDRADVRDSRALVGALEGAEVVYNLAAAHRDDVRPAALYDEVNVGGAVNVCNACSEVGIGRLIFTSSVAVYGLGPSNASEERAPAPFNPYGLSKLRAEQVHRAWQAERPDSRSLVIVRPTVVFGEGSRGNVYQLVRQIMARRFVMVGSGGNRKSMAYVGNVSSFLGHVLVRGPGTHLFNYADGPELSMEELVQTILEALGRSPVIGSRIPYAVGYLGGLACDALACLTGRRLPISAVRIRKFCSTTTFSTERLNATGFRPPISLRDALVKTIEHEVRAAAARGATGAR